MADMLLLMVADKVAGMVADMVAGHGFWLIGPKLFNQSPTRLASKLCRFMAPIAQCDPFEMQFLGQKSFFGGILQSF